MVATARVTSTGRDDGLSANELCQVGPDDPDDDDGGGGGRGNRLMDRPCRRLPPVFADPVGDKAAARSEAGDRQPALCKRADSCCSLLFFCLTTTSRQLDG